MMRKLRQVLRSVMLWGKQRKRRGFKITGGLLVLLWVEAGDGQSLNCTVAAAGPWWSGIEVKELQPDLKESMFPCVWSCLPDPEELGAFTDLYGSLRLLVSFKMNDATSLSPEWCSHVEAFLRTFSLANAGIQIHLKFKFNQLTVQRVFRAKIRTKVVLANQPPPMLDVTSYTQPPEGVKQGCWCQGGHPVVGDRLPLTIPPEAMDQGLFGELSVQPVTVLSPCVLQYPNLATRLTHIQSVKAAGFCLLIGMEKVWLVSSNCDFQSILGQFTCFYVLICCPSNVPVTGPSAFYQELPAHLDCHELGLHAIHFPSSTDHGHSDGIVYTVEQENWEDPQQKLSLQSVQQRLVLFLFLQHSDPFTLHLSDAMASELLIERHLEDILNNNRKAVITALQTELKNTLKTQNRRIKDQEKLRSAGEVILSSSISIVSCSTNVDFRNACLNSMKVSDTHELSVSLRESVGRVTSWKFISRRKCYSAQMEEHPESDEHIRAEI